MTKRLMVLKESLQKNDEKYNNLKDLLSMPMMACTAMESDSAMSEQVQQMMQAAQHNPQILQQTMGQMEEKFGDLPDTILDQAAISYVKGAYQDLGMDMDHIQLHYLFTQVQRCCSWHFVVWRSVSWWDFWRPELEPAPAGI